MQLERLEFEFDTGIDPLTGEKRPPVRAVSRPEDRFDLYYVAEDKRGHHCGEALCEEIVPILAKKGNYVLVSYVENRIIILNEDDEPRQLLPFHDGTWVGFETLSVSGGRIPCRLMDLDPSQDVCEILHRSWAVRNEWRVPARELVKKCDRLWRI